MNLKETMRLRAMWHRGRILTEDGGNPMLVSHVDLRARQSEERFIGFASGDGSYRVEGLQPGPFTLKVTPLPHYRDRLNRKPQLSFLKEQFELEMPDSGGGMELDIVLQPASYLFGRVIDRDDAPVVGIAVKAEGEDSGYAASTNANGVFLIETLRSDVAHTLTVARDGGGEPLLRLEGVRPPQENILIQVNLGE